MEFIFKYIFCLNLEDSFDSRIDCTSQIGSGEIPDEEFIGNRYNEPGIRSEANAKNGELVTLE